jgi:hypothetical protein
MSMQYVDPHGILHGNDLEEAARREEELALDDWADWADEDSSSEVREEDEYEARTGSGVSGW